MADETEDAFVIRGFLGAAGLWGGTGLSVRVGLTDWDEGAAVGLEELEEASEGPGVSPVGAGWGLSASVGPGFSPLSVEEED